MLGSCILLGLVIEFSSSEGNGIMTQVVSDRFVLEYPDGSGGWERGTMAFSGVPTVDDPVLEIICRNRRIRREDVRLVRVVVTEEILSFA